MKITRRQFLRRTILGALLLGGAVVVGRHVGGYRLTPGLAGRLRHLSDKEMIVFLAVARRILAGDAAAPPPDEVAIGVFVDGYLGRLDAFARSDVKALLQLVEHGSGAFRLSTARFTAMSAAEQDATLRDWQSSRLDVRRQGLQALKSLALLAYYSDGRSWPMIGYGGPLVAARGITP